MFRLSRRSFTLVEILIVVAIIALLAAIAIPGLLRSRISANESKAQANLKVIGTALEMFSATNGRYPNTEGELTGVIPPYLNRTFENVTIDGYNYMYTNVEDSDYQVDAFAATAGVTGTRDYWIEPGPALFSEEADGLPHGSGGGDDDDEFPIE